MGKLRFSSFIKSGNLQEKVPIPSPSKGRVSASLTAARQRTGRAETRYSSGKWESKLSANRPPSVPGVARAARSARAIKRPARTATAARRARRPSPWPASRSTNDRTRRRRPLREPDIHSPGGENGDSGRLEKSALGPAHDAHHGHDQHQGAEQSQRVGVDGSSRESSRHLPEWAGLGRENAGALEASRERRDRDSPEGRADRRLPQPGPRTPREKEKARAREESRHREHALADRFRVLQPRPVDRASVKAASDRPQSARLDDRQESRHEPDRQERPQDSRRRRSGREDSRNRR